MRIPRFSEILLALWAVVQTETPSAARSVKELVDLCQAPQSNQVAVPYCIGLIEGVTSILELNGAMAKRNREYRDRELICPPKHGANNGTRVQIFLDWSRDHQGEQSTIDVVGIIAAFQEAWPCHFPD